MVKKMDIPLVIDEKDPKWILLGKILDRITSRRAKQEMAKQGIVPVNRAGLMFKIVLIAMFFSVDISYVVSELQKRGELRSQTLFIREMLCQSSVHGFNDIRDGLRDVFCRNSYQNICIKISTKFEFLQLFHTFALLLHNYPNLY